MDSPGTAVGSMGGHIGGKDVEVSCGVNASAGARERVAGVGGRERLKVASGALKGPNPSSEVGVGTK